MADLAVQPPETEMIVTVVAISESVRYNFRIEGSHAGWRCCQGQQGPRFRLCMQNADPQSKC
ncbi:hypothetical protein TRIUR3_32174 [Triticum urartu]|uniref:Uncharacterized protein n=1 Tax=Triticum urartu TaxID=4572 RepID=M7ZF58_TRIUA|nr:hypothetical protein TRIUR3_32174 [Triticum urartu]